MLSSHRPVFRQFPDGGFQRLRGAVLSSTTGAGGPCNQQQPCKSVKSQKKLDPMIG